MLEQPDIPGMNAGLVEWTGSVPFCCIFGSTLWKIGVHCKTFGGIH
jgi:hypothetical protein